MKLTIEIALDNAAFGPAAEDRNHEIMRILDQMMENLDGKNLETGVGLYDYNGNRVGQAHIR